MGLKNKRRIAKNVQSSAIAVSVIGSVGMFAAFGGVMASNLMYMHHDAQLPNKLALVEKSEGYENYINDEIGEFYLDLRAGKLTTNEFAKKCSRIKNDQTLIDYAKSSDNKEIKQVLEEHDKRNKDLEDTQLGFAIASLCSMAGTVGGAIVDAIAYKQRKRYERLILQARAKANNKPSQEEMVMGDE